MGGDPKARLLHEAAARIDKLERERDEARARAERAEAALAEIEEDGTEEHNAAVNLRSELARERGRAVWAEGKIEAVMTDLSLAEHAAKKGDPHSEIVVRIQDMQRRLRAALNKEPSDA